jgi:nicotinate-nucleotide pyrophosphorylase (carboxylating)
MSEVSRILDQLRRAWDGEAWHGPPLWKIVHGVSAKTAAARPVAGAHSIAEIVLHISAWQEAATRRLQGQEYEPSPAENWPEVTGLSEPAWENTLFELRRSFEELCAVVEDFKDEQLDRAVNFKSYSQHVYSYYVLLHGVVQHNLYHAGQIALLKKLAEQAPADRPDRPAFGAIEAAACARLLELALEEDLGSGGDVTSVATVPADRAGRAVLASRAAGVVAGLPAAMLTFRKVDPELRFETHLPDGSAVLAGARLATVRGKLRSILAAERVALNFVGRLSGIATATRQHVEAIAGLPCRVFDTRKTTPGWRVLEKYAVRCGGGDNHRMGLDTGILIKDNHLAALGTGPQIVAEAIRRSRDANEPGLPVEVEVDTLEQLDAALAEKPDVVLLDNMPPDQLREAVRRRNAAAPGVKLEASGGVTLANLRAVAETGVDRISIGALTHSAPALDVGLDYLP